MDLCGCDVVLVVSIVSEAGEPLTIHVDIERTIASAQHVQPEVKLLMPNQQWILDIFLTNVSLILS